MAFLTWLYVLFTVTSFVWIVLVSFRPVFLLQLQHGSSTPQCHAPIDTGRCFIIAAVTGVMTVVIISMFQ